MSPSATITPKNVSFELKQPLYKSTQFPAIRVSTISEHQITLPLLEKFVDTPSSVVGLAGEYKSGRLIQLTLATSREALLIRLNAHGNSNSKAWTHLLLATVILLDPAITLIAFNLDRLALALHGDMDLKINNGVDMLTLLPKPAVRSSVHTVASVLGGSEMLHMGKVANVFQNEKYEKDSTKRHDHSVLRAWSACHVAHMEKWASTIVKVNRVETWEFEKMHLDFLAKLVRTSFGLEALKPAFTKNDVGEDMSLRKGKVEVTGTRYKTRLRVSGSQTLRLEIRGKENTTHTGRVTDVQGRSAYISTDKPIPRGSIHSITTIGKDAPTSAESERAHIILGVLQRRISLFQNSLVRTIWFSNGARPNTQPADSTAQSSWQAAVRSPLNPSQTQAVESMLRPCLGHDDPLITIIQGPPGSGKTSVIAGFVQAIQGLSKVEYGEVVYLIAQSNVAVKNMAEKLAKVGFNHWKLIVSHDFHFEWHEHLYGKISSKVIVSKDLSSSSLETERKFRDARVILCTLSMLSSQRLAESGLTRLFPPRTIIVDEASQIEVGDYLPVFHAFAKFLRRVCFVGDDKQLAPFGQDDIAELQSIFEIQSLRRTAIFLDTQYRMPKPIGKFISGAVYDGRLQTSHPTNSKASCRFVDIDNGQETKDGHSWKNIQEIQTVLRLVRKAAAKGEDFRVITPYDAQRNGLENALKHAGLPWEDRCFNVDSFQGNEADHIIISVVRTQKPGFLNNKRRTNVLLTRCKRKMTICSNRQFLQGEARKTLIGQMASIWADHWVSWRDVLNGHD